LSGADAAPVRAAPVRDGVREADPLALVLFAALVLACFGAFFLTQRLKHTPTAVQNFKLAPRFSPLGRLREEPISFKLARADRVTVSVVDSQERVVATLVRNRRVARYKQFSLRWNGRLGTAHRLQRLRSENGRTILVPLNAGPLAPPGEYRVRVSLAEQGRTVLSPRSFTLVGG
jgi:hypothetical protein